ncbi:MAG TPA: hypothetical protein VFV92_01100 [Candidatus Bathyarchaeia archaeon]|nr:hypothetical protein [Candidatus Bathyarchaeia archaeon]
MTTTTDKRKLKKLEKSARNRSIEDGIVMRGLMDTMQGRQFVYNKLAAAHVFHTSFSPNALIMAFNEGERSRGLDLLADIMMYCPEKYVLMTREANDRTSSTQRSVNEDPSGRIEGSELDAAESDPRGPDGGPDEEPDSSGPDKDDTPDIYRDWEAEQQRSETKPN